MSKPTAPYITMMRESGWRDVTFKQAHRALRMKLENAHWEEQAVNPNLHTMYAYYNERIANGAENSIAFWTNN